MFTFENLVMLKSDIETTIDGDLYKPNRYYRCMPTDETNYPFILNGTGFTQKNFDEHFEFVHTRVMKHFVSLGLVDEKLNPVSKAKFTKLADIHTYGRGKKAFKIWFFRNSRDVMYGFYPMQGNKTDNANECYQYFTDIVSGNVECLDTKDVQFGNCGVPISYGNLRVL